MRSYLFLGLAGLLGCRPAQPLACPAPSQGLFVTQVLLQRGAEVHPRQPDFAIAFTASGDALYAGSSHVPVPGNYMGRIGAERFSALVNRLVAAGLPEPGTASTVAADPTCSTRPTVTLSYTTTGGQYGQVAVCSGSSEESRLMGPLYRLIEETRWQPGGTSLSLSLASR